ncbi:MAG: hypothetical protein U0640_09865 [Phycisphaerales bacterium]
MRVPHSDYTIFDHDIRRDNQPVGTFLSSANALDEASWPSRITPTKLLLVRSGFAPSDELDQPLWLPTPRAQWSKFAKHLESICPESTQLVLWPRSTDVISDSPSTLSFIRSNPKWKFLVDPASLITESMRRDVMEHVDRLIELMIAHDACAGIIHPGENLASPALSAFEKTAAARNLAWWRIESTTH